MESHANAPGRPSGAYTLATAPGALPGLGHLVRLVRDPLGLLTSLPAHGDLVRLRVGPVRVLVVCHPELARQVLVNDRVFDKVGTLWRRAQEVIGDGLPAVPRDRHRRPRRLVQPGFHRERLPEYAEVMSAQIAAVTGSWRDGQVVDAQTESLAITCGVAARTMFDLPGDEERAAVLRRAMPELTQGVYRRMLAPPLLDRLPTPGKRRYDRASAEIRQIAAGLITEYRRTPSGGVRDLLSMLLAARGEDDRPLDDTELCDQVLALFTANADTTAAGLSWALHLLAEHPEHQRRVAAEAQKVLAGRDASWEHVPDLHQTRAAVSETLRLYPPAWILPRSVASDTELGGHRVAAGTAVVHSPLVLHRHPGLYPDPERFVPDRWLDEPARPGGETDAFGDGPRKCVGEAFALVELTLALAHIASRWHVTSTGPVRPAIGTTLRPGGLRLRLSARTGGTPAAAYA